MPPAATARLLCVPLLLALALTLATGATWISTPRADAADVSADPSTTFEAKVLRQVNRVRFARDLRRVRASACLDGLAAPWAAHLAEVDSLVHRDQSTVLSRCSMSWAGENLGSGSSLTARQLVRAWMDSPPHREVLLKPRARRGAVAAASAGDGPLYVVLNLGDPR